MNVVRPSSLTARVCGLAMSCSSAPKRIASPRDSSPGQAARPAAPASARAVAGKPRAPDRPAARSCSPAPRACARRRRGGDTGSGARPAGPSSSGRMTAVDAQRLHQLQAGDRPRRRPRSAATRRRRARAPPRPAPRRAWRAARAVSGSTSKSSSHASRAVRSARSGSAANACPDTIRRRRAARSVAGRRKGPQLAVAEALGDRVDGEIALGQIGLDAPLDQRQDVDLPAMVARYDAPAAKALRELERVRVEPTASARARLRGASAVAMS